VRMTAAFSARSAMTEKGIRHQLFWLRPAR
jgi:hypothetical protein